MSKKENKTQPTKVNPKTYISSIDHPKRKQDGLELLEFFNRVTGLKPVMWGPSIIGYGRYHYKYKSGREGDFLMTGFSPRKSALTLYIMPGYKDMSDELSRLGKYRLGRSCLYINKLSDVDMNVVEEMILKDLEYMREHYETWDE